MLAASAAPQLYAWSTETDGERRLVVAATLEAELDPGTSVRFELTGEASRSELVCTTLSPGNVRCDWARLDPRCVGCDRSVTTTEGTATGETLRLFAGWRADPSPARPRRTARRRRDRSDDDPAQLPVHRPTYALVAELPLPWLGPPGRLEVSAERLVRSWLPETPTLAPHTGCEGLTVLRVEADPWSEERPVVSVQGQRLSSPDGPTAILPDADVEGAVVEIGEQGRCALLGARSQTLACGDVQVAVHVAPLCDELPTDEVETVFGRPVLPLPPEKLDLRDGVLDGNEPDLLAPGPLRLDTTRVCRADAVTYLENERAERTDRDPRTCGGRTPGGQAFDVLLTHAVNGPGRLPPGAPTWGDAPASEAPLRNDGVEPPSPLDRFPWLATP